MLNNADIILPFFINYHKSRCKYTKKRGIMSTFANKNIKDERRMSDMQSPSGRKSNNDMRKAIRDIFGYLLGLVLFVGLMPTLMWLASGRPAFWAEVAVKDMVAWGLMLCGLLLSVWTIVYMKLRGKGNPMDAFGHEVAPRTQHLMTDGPYRINRNPMLTGTLIYLIGFALWLCTWQALIVWILFFAIMFIQVLSEERRLRRDFGNEYDAYCRHTRRF